MPVRHAATPALRAPGALLPVTEAGDAHLDPVARQMVLHALERQSASGDRGAQRHVEGAAAQGRVQLRGGDVRVLWWHAACRGAFL